MSLILKGIDLPKEGEEITLAIFHDGDIVSYKYWLPKEAEAIQIPKGHGDIKDVGKELKELQMMKVEGEEFTTAVNFAIDCWQNAPTILEEGK